MSDLPDLYPEAILEHATHPRNRRILPDHTHLAHSDHPVCGDEATVYLRISRRGVIREASFEGRSCAIATASASLMSEALKGKTRAQAKLLFDCFHALATGEAPPPLDGMMSERESLGLLAGVRAYSVRMNCASLAWETMLTALDSPKEAKVNLDRTVLVFAASVILLSLVLSQLYSPLWLLLTAWVGVVMLQSAFTGFCPAAKLFKWFGVRPGSAFH